MLKPAPVDAHACQYFNGSSYKELDQWSCRTHFDSWNSQRSKQFGLRVKGVTFPGPSPLAGPIANPAVRLQAGDSTFPPAAKNFERAKGLMKFLLRDYVINMFDSVLFF